MTELLVGVVILAGVAGTVLPILPGVPLVWGAALLYGLIEGFGTVGWTAMAVITLVGGAGIAAGVIVPQRAAWTGGIGVTGQVLALVLAVAGFFLIPVVGAGVGFVVGVYLAARRRHADRAWGVTKATLKAMILAAGLQLAAAVVMAATWLVWITLT